MQTTRMWQRGTPTTMWQEDVEECRTVVIGNSTKENAKNIGVYGDYNKADDITENGLRKEHGLPLRMRYVADE